MAYTKTSGVRIRRKSKKKWITSNEDRRRLDDLFNIALVLITVLGAAEFAYVAVVATDISDKVLSFWITTYPIVALIIAWIMKELVSVHAEMPQNTSHVRIAKLTNWFYGEGIILFTEFCWFFWATIFYYYLNFFLDFVTRNVYLVQFILLTLIVYIGLVSEIGSAYKKLLGKSCLTRRSRIYWICTVFLVLSLWVLMGSYVQLGFIISHSGTVHHLPHLIKKSKG